MLHSTARGSRSAVGSCVLGIVSCIRALTHLTETLFSLRVALSVKTLTELTLRTLSCSERFP